jgi:hypothetical protein
MVDVALRLGAIKTPLLVEPVLFDAVKMTAKRGSSTFMFPCEAGGIEVGGRPVLYLDKTPALPPGGSVTLTGCQLSMRIFRYTYGREPDFVNICPRDLAKAHFEPGKLHIARCCDVHRVRVEGGLALVQYGARIEEIVQAIRELTGEAHGSGPHPAPSI